MTIGQWIRRVRQTDETFTPSGDVTSRKVLTKWHLVDSVVDGEAFTRCGRRLRKQAKTEFEAVDTMPLTRMIGQPQLCGGCQ